MTRDEVEPVADADADRAIMAFIRGSRKASDLPRVGPFVLLLTDVTRLRFLTACRALSFCHLWHHHLNRC